MIVLLIFGSKKLRGLDSDLSASIVGMRDAVKENAVQPEPTKAIEQQETGTTSQGKRVAGLGSQLLTATWTLLQDRRDAVLIDLRSSEEVCEPFISRLRAA